MLVWVNQGSRFLILFIIWGFTYPPLVSRFLDANGVYLVYLFWDLSLQPPTKLHILQWDTFFPLFAVNV